MKRYGSVIGVRAEKLAEYKKLHSAVWPAVLDMIKKCHIENYSIYQKDELLFSYFEYTGSDYNKDMQMMATTRPLRNGGNCAVLVSNRLSPEKTVNGGRIWTRCFISTDLKKRMFYIT